MAITVECVEHLWLNLRGQLCPIGLPVFLDMLQNSGLRFHFKQYTLQISVTLNSGLKVHNIKKLDNCLRLRVALRSPSLAFGLLHEETLHLRSFYVLYE